jgi:uncharacterized protein YjbI with pentapeptide repeats
VSENLRIVSERRHMDASSREASTRHSRPAKVAWPWQCAIALASLLATVAASSGPARASCGDSPGKGVDWSSCNKAKLILAGEDLSGANLQRALLDLTDFAEANLSGADLSEASLSRTRLAGANLAGANLSKAMMDRTDLKGANLVGANFEKSELHRAILDGANLQGANLAKAELSRAVVTNADLTKVNLHRAYLARVDLRGSLLAQADLGDAELYLADLGGADLSGAVNLTQEQLLETCGDGQTKLPAGLSPPSGWPCVSREEE